MSGREPFKSYLAKNFLFRFIKYCMRVNNNYNVNINFGQKVPITRHLKLKCLTLKIKNFKFASNLRENF